MIVSNLIKEIQVSANDILARLSDGQLSVRIEKPWSILVDGLTFGQKYDMLSSGQKFRVDLSLRVALSSVSAARSKISCKTLIIDEGLGSLDPVGRKDFMKVIDSLSNRFHRIIVITHTDISESAQNLIEVRRACKGSYLAIN